MSAVAVLRTHGETLGEAWGAGIARCLSLKIDRSADVGHEEDDTRLLPIPENFICPMTMAVMQDPVATVDGERRSTAWWISWFAWYPITSPCELTSKRFDG